MTMLAGSFEAERNLSTLSIINSLIDNGRRKTELISIFYIENDALKLCL